jgi:hypothetical protein
MGTMHILVQCGRLKARLWHRSGCVLCGNKAAREILAQTEILSEISRLPSASPPASTEQSDGGGDVGVGFLAESFLQPGESASCPAVILAYGARVVHIVHGEEGLFHTRHRRTNPPTRTCHGDVVEVCTVGGPRQLPSCAAHLFFIFTSPLGITQALRLIAVVLSTV